MPIINIAYYRVSSKYWSFNLWRIYAGFTFTFFRNLMLQHCTWPSVRQCCHQLSIKGVFFCLVPMYLEKRVSRLMFFPVVDKEAKGGK
jgi:hypothetical protein